jgi:hypothetical protein
MRPDNTSMFLGKRTKVWFFRPGLTDKQIFETFIQTIQKRKALETINPNSEGLEPA